MKKIIFLYSGEGTKSEETSFKLIKTSPRWQEIADILQDKLGINLEEIWSNNSDSHRCPHSPILTVTAEICLSDIWMRWGYKPDIVVGHSVGELTAAYQAGLYSLEEILLLTHKIGQAAAKIEGSMLHGLMSEAEIAALNVSLSSRNFLSEGKTHITVSGTHEEMQAFLNQHDGFAKMKPAHPWHHRHYSEYSPELKTISLRRADSALFISGVTAQFEDQLGEEHWQNWLSAPIDFVSSMAAINDRFSTDEIEIIEIGFHPVLKKCCDIFEKYQYASSMYRGEDEIEWILFQRKKLGQSNLLYEIKQITESFRPGLDFDIPLAYQDFTSFVFVEFAALLQPYFPFLAPQDFYRYKSVQKLIDQFGATSEIYVETDRHYQRNRVVISAMSCRFPSSVETLPQYWDSLQAGEDQVKADPVRGDFEAGFLDSTISRFDHRYFNISEAEARSMDPQQILALELTEMLWKDSGIDPATLDKNRIGVYIGAWNDEYRGNKDSVYYPTGTNPSIIASRISYHYDLRGPSWVANTACSSSLLAVHYACKDIEAGRVDYAIAGGVNMILGNGYTHSMRDSGFLSKDQRCKTFDDSANGYVRAEGGGLVLLVHKDLAAHYYAEVLGSSINQNGARTQVITAPHPAAQEDLILEACRDAHVKPADIAYVECHGTGTKIGDPIEISALQNTIAQNRKTTCYLGSVKSNMGHLESAAGIAGLLKSVLILNQGTIPGNIHFNTPNKFIDFDSYMLSVVDKPTPIDPLALVGVSSFGFGGANAHIIICGAEPTARKQMTDLQIPFDRRRGAPLKDYYQLNQDAVEIPEEKNEVTGTTGVRNLVIKTFFDLTGIETITPDIALTDQGLDSLSATDFVGTLQKSLNIELDADLLFDYPLIDPLVSFLEETQGTTGAQEETGIPESREELEEMISGIFHELTNVGEIDAGIELTDQGLDSMSATQMIMQLESKLGIEIDTDILFEHPLYDQLVDEIYRCLQKELA
jgi:acyl transferase domain-containing protein/acyl carrier protein